MLLQLLLIAALTGCADLFGPKRPPPQDPRVTQLWITTSGWILDPGDSIRFDLRAGNKDNQVLYESPGTLIHPSWPADLKVRWTSADTSVVAVTDSGVVRARRPGRTTVWAEARGIRDSATVTVNPVPGAIQRTYGAVRSGVAAACALATSGKVFCWGSNWYGGLGMGTIRRHRGYLAPVPSAAGQQFTSSGTGSFHSCGLTDSGAAFCWGEGANGKLGDPAIDWMSSRGSPVRVTGGRAFKTLAVGSQHNCGIAVDDGVYCWGLNDQGQLGNGQIGASQSSGVPVRVLTTQRFTQLALSLSHSCGVTASGEAYCWGQNGNGALGTGSWASSATPVRSAEGLTFASLAAGVDYTCGVTPEGEAYCWGRNWQGQLGYNAVGGASAAPVKVLGGLRFQQIAAGLAVTCGVTSAGDGYCWGDDLSGSVGAGWPRGPGGTGTDYMIPRPTRVLGGLKWKLIQPGLAGETCGITTAGELYCWGSAGAGTGNIKPERAGESSGYAVPVRVAPPL